MPNKSSSVIRYNSLGRRKSIKSVQAKNTLAKKKKSPIRNSLIPRKLGPEAQVQKALCQYIAAKYPEVWKKHTVKIHNEIGRGRVTTHLLKMQGLHPGASDLFISYPNGKYHGLWLEIKKEGYKPSASDKEHYARQISFIKDQRAVGYFAEVGVGLDECINIVDTYMKVY